MKITKDKNTKKVLYLCNIPSPYMVDYLNELGKYCSLTAIFERSKSTERGDRWNNYNFISFNGKVLKGLNYNHDQSFSPSILLHLIRDKYDFIFITNPLTLTGILSIEFFRICKINYIIESEGSFPKDGKGLKEKFKKHIISNSYQYFSTTKLADDYLITYGASSAKIIKYPYSSIFDRDVLSVPVSQQRKIYLREKLNIVGKIVVVAVGRFIKLKRYEELIETWRGFNPDHQLLIIGEGPEKENYERLIFKYNLTNVKIVGFLQKEELVDYYDASDIFVHPTESDVWGLVINEAMSRGLPVITTSKCIAGLELVKGNGYIVNYGIDEIREKIENIINDDNLRNFMSIKSLEIIKKYTIETMALKHIDYINQSENNLC